MQTTNPDDQPVSDEPSSRSAFQFSIRNLLVLTAFVSVCLATSLYLAGFLAVVILVVLVEVAVLLAAEWLILPENRVALAFVTAGSWIIVGSGFMIIGISQFASAFGIAGADKSSILGVGLVAIGAVCWLVAARRWRQLTAGPSPRR